MSQHELNGGDGEFAVPPPESHALSLPEATLIERAQFSGWLHQAPQETEAEAPPAVVAIPAPDEGVESLEELKTSLLQAGITMLVIEWGDEPAYPESLAILPAAIAFLVSSAAAHPDRIGALGVDVGADLVIRSASTDPQIRSVLAVGPYMTTAVARAGLLPRLRRSRQRDLSQFVEQIASGCAAREMAGRQLHIIFGEQDQLIDTDKALQELEAIGMQDRVTIFTHEKHHLIIRTPAAVQLATEWFRKSL